jgi:hypothetical protein
VREAPHEEAFVSPPNEVHRMEDVHLQVELAVPTQSERQRSKLLSGFDLPSIIG